MEMKPEHKKLLLAIGLRDEDLLLLDGDKVGYEFDPERGVRIYDPYYRTSYPEYIDLDGWSAWSSEQDTFHSGVLKETLPEAARRIKMSPVPGPEEIEAAMKKRFRKKRG